MLRLASNASVQPHQAIGRCFLYGRGNLLRLGESGLVMFHEKRAKLFAL